MKQMPAFKPLVSNGIAFMGKRLTDRERVIKKAVERFLEGNDIYLPRKHHVIAKGLA